MKTQLIQKLEWEVKTQPVLYSVDGLTMENPNYMHISKSTGQPLSVMGSKYCPLTVEDFSKNVELLQQVSGYTLNGYQEFKEGKTILGILQSPDLGTQATIPALNYIVVGSSFDGSRPFFIGNSTLLIRCQNAFSQISMFDTVKHTKSSPLKIERLQQAFAAYLKDQQNLHVNFEKMDLFKVNDEDKIKYARTVLNILPEKELSTLTQNRLDELVLSINEETKDVGNTVFGMFQGVTKYTTHNLKQKDEIFGNIFGTKDFYNQKAYKEALHLVA